MAALDKLKILAGSEEDFAELTASFLEEAPQLMNTVVASFAAGDLLSVRRSVHSLKSNARDFGADELASVCARIEHTILQGGSPSPADVAAISHLIEIAARELGSL
jgi:HPt (histidine-containing phosphotransfer) domain-containing protein